MQLLVRKNFIITVDHNLQRLTYNFSDGAECCIWPNESDKEHGRNLGLCGLNHKILHEIAHYYIAEALGYACCPIVYAQAHNGPMPENAAYLEEIIFSMVYFICQRNMLYSNWWGYLDRLHDKDVYTIAHKINTAFSYARNTETILL